MLQRRRQFAFSSKRALDVFIASNSLLLLLLQCGEAAAKKWNDAVKLKKIFVLAAILAEEAKTQKNPNSLKMDRVSKFLETPWRPAEAWHFFILAQQQIQQGNAAVGMRTALKLQDYSDILDEETILSVLALASATNKCFGICSKAFTGLESNSKVFYHIFCCLDAD